MPGTYTVEPIAGAQIEQAYPLLCGAAPGIRLARWRSFCQRQDAAAAGQTVLAVRNAQGYVQGLCAYGKLDHLVHGMTIEVPIFIVASVADPAGVADALLRGLWSRCIREGCAGILIEASGLDAPLRRRLEGYGTVDAGGSVHIARDDGLRLGNAV